MEHTHTWLNKPVSPSSSSVTALVSVLGGGACKESVSTCGWVWSGLVWVGMGSVFVLVGACMEVHVSVNSQTGTQLV